MTHRIPQPPHLPATFSRRDMLFRAANGFGGLALTAMLAEEARTQDDRSVDPMLVRPPHFAPKAKSVIFLFMDGGPSHVDTFDPKPRLREEDGQPLPLKLPRTANASNTRLLGSFWDFNKHGQSGMDVSTLFPESSHLRRRPVHDPLDGVGLLRAHRRELLHA